jgi:hypothetical protein
MADVVKIKDAWKVGRWLTIAVLAATLCAGLALCGVAGAQDTSAGKAKAASAKESGAHAGDASKILHEAVKASGGAGVLSKIRTVTLEGSVAAKDGAAGAAGAGGTFTWDMKLPNRYYMEIVAGDRSVIESFNGKSAWRENAAGELGTLVGPEAMQVEAAARYYNAHLVGLKKAKLLVKYVGTAQVRGKDAVELEVTSISGGARQVYFDAQTHLVSEEAATMGGVAQKIFYEDYRAASGVMLPYKIRIERDAVAYDIQITRAAVNEMVGERVFDFPRKSQVVLPDLKKLFAEVHEREAANEKLRQKYAGTKIETENGIDKKGNATKTEVTESAFFYLNGTEVERLLKKDGVPLSDAERKAEDERVAKEVARLRKPPAAPKKDAEASKDTAADAGADAKKDDDAERSDDDVKDSDFSVDTFLRVAQLVNPRRERYQGQDVLAFDFEPNPEYKAHGLVEKIVQKLGGVMWIDEKKRDVVRLDAFFESDMKIAGGLLADLEKDTRVQILNTYVNDEVWVPEYEEVRIAFRLMLVKTFRIEDSTKYFDYKKFDPATADVGVK